MATKNKVEKIDEISKEIENQVSEENELENEKVINDMKKEAEEKAAAKSRATKALDEAVVDNIKSKQEADKAYMINHTNAFLQKCKEDEVDYIVGEKFYSTFFGKTYTFMYNCAPVTIKFDGSKQSFPKFVAKRIREKISEVANSNFPKEENTKLDI